MTRYHIHTTSNGWCIRRNGKSRGRFYSPTRKACIREALLIVQEYIAGSTPCEIVIHNKDGLVYSRVTYDVGVTS